MRPRSPALLLLRNGTEDEDKLVIHHFKFSYKDTEWLYCYFVPTKLAVIVKYGRGYYTHGQ